MTADPLVLVPEVSRSTARLLETVRTFDGAGLAAPTLCPGWTRGHIVTHLARNAAGYVNLFTWALADLVATHEAFLAAVDEMPPSAWAVEVRLGSGTVVPAAKVVWSRLSEIEIHHVDLCAGYGPPDWPPGFAQRLLLHELTVPEGVTGPDHALAAWLLGRSDGTDLTRSTPEESEQ